MASEVEALAEVLNDAYRDGWREGEAMARAILASPWLAAHDAEVAARALRDMARQMREDYALVWGGDERWLTTGTHIANLVADCLDTDAEEIAASQGAGESGEEER